ncbi:TetR/AcrR family transcriptional regulator [Nodosilinea sp. LEGE 07088]|uniref:TetR/AcrR family transcriptional regulator n=1 Tax=Nodosilinea sp. LEGE 07088 TaxID=2777968 RepID=UPI001882AA69|nr:TetR/AcrR family transcriptional regulator [Nodosilinea sp. LEGE 07088]MBE9140188.1 TetR/AcrR family transcriptional regulator [Nodosilinea sp. LEGE 07088]
MAKKTTYHHGDLRQALVDGAIAMIAEQDIGRLSLREVARRVGVSHAAPYRHFQDREELLAAVGEEGFIGLTQAMETGQAQAAADPLERLRATGVAYVQFAVTHPSHYRVMFGSFGAEHCPHPQRAQVGWQAFQVLLTSIEAGQQAGVLRTGDAMQLAWVAWSTVHGLAMLLIDKRLPVTQPEAMTALAEFVTQMLIGGLAIAPPTEP